MLAGYLSAHLFLATGVRFPGLCHRSICLRLSYIFTVNVRMRLRREWRVYLLSCCFDCTVRVACYLLFLYHSRNLERGYIFLLPSSSRDEIRWETRLYYLLFCHVTNQLACDKREREAME